MNFEYGNKTSKRSINDEMGVRDAGRKIKYKKIPEQNLQISHHKDSGQLDFLHTRCPSQHKSTNPQNPNLNSIRAESITFKNDESAAAIDRIGFGSTRSRLQTQVLVKLTSNKPTPLYPHLANAMGRLRVRSMAGREGSVRRHPGVRAEVLYKRGGRFGQSLAPGYEDTFDPCSGAQKLPSTSPCHKNRTWC